MFSGIVEETAKLVRIEKEQSNIHFYFTCSFGDQLRIDQSVAHNGVCLTVVEIDKPTKTYKVTAMKETLDKSNLGLLNIGDEVNIERSMSMDKLLDGGSWYYTFEYDKSKGNITVEKGSVSVNGVSLTVVNSKANTFSVSIIPYTYQVTNFHCFKVGTIVNLEFDIIGKYIQKIMAGYLEGLGK